MKEFFEGIDPTIASALIGVLGVLLGSAVTIIATAMMRHFDLQREDQREKSIGERRRMDKELQMKQEIYKNFLNELSSLEAFEYASLENMQREWIKTEVKVDLVASPRIREAKEKLQDALFELADKNLKAKNIQLSSKYLTLRDELLAEIRADLAILQKKHE